ncbi:carboxylate-amine ligase [uncultured Sneathiella sp.]|jgi:carboxylate-amine ligase|uniref:carboxylate-amine ligase n=1 Tax=uncultured Sneathiella sp. TaxID=879315 RepID=UPI0030D915CB|tara:strand:- start:6453 stop:7595 length:1143 start_codon:yes stop_codon:yes gene_type:complete
MSIAEPSFTIGIEEEYLLVDLETRALAIEPSEDILSECERLLPDHLVTPEFLRSQLEVGTRVCKNITEARAALYELRRTVADVANQHGLGVMAASVHPFADWHQLKHTPKERYDVIARDMQATVRRLMICGMHVHCAIEDPELRIDLMNQASYFLPHLLALSTSSPFWRGEESGLKSYRMTVFDALPRTGIPDRFESYGEFSRLIDTLVEAGALEDGSKLWWDMRPSSKFPTLEMRLCDVCPLVEDSLTIAALYSCILRMLYRLRRNNQRWRVYPQTLVAENRWIAQRFGVEGKLIDFGIPAPVPAADLIEEIIGLTAEDAAFLGCEKEVAHAREIVRRGTSADRQLSAYHEAIKGGASKEDALVKVVDQVLKETVSGLQ